MAAFDNNAFENYRNEAKAKWGQTDAWREHAEKTKGYSGQKWNVLAAGMDELMASFARCMQEGHAADSDKARQAVTALQEYITEHCYTCTDAILSGLGQMYVGDERFRKNIDRHGVGTAQFICEAIEAYCVK